MIRVLPMVLGGVRERCAGCRLYAVDDGLAGPRNTGR